MSVTGVEPTPRGSVLSELDKIVHSHVLKGSESLCRLLRFLVERHVEQPGVQIKEYQIATEVLGRPSDFDPRLDATVRVQTGRLRSKLVEYYAGEGGEDPVIFDLPRGSYSLLVHWRAEAPPHNGPSGSTEGLAAPAARPSSAAFWVLSIVCLSLLAALVYVVVRRPVVQVAAPAADTAPPTLRLFWRRFIDRPEDPLVVFSNAEFVGRPETGMRYFNPARDAREAIFDHYTGVGEVLAIHELDRLFASLNHNLRVKRGRLLTLDDAKNNDLIFVGSPSENLTLREIPTTREFVFRVAAGGARKGDLEIVNLHPRPGEDQVFLGTKTIPLSEDHSLVALVPGVNSGLWVMILAGTTTIGTQAAVEFVCRERALGQLQAALGGVGGEFRPFEAVIRVKVSGGVPVTTELVALHAREGS